MDGVRTKLTHDRMMALLASVPGANPISERDRRNSISSEVIRCTLNGEPAVAVGAEYSVKTKVGALLDLLDLTLADGELPERVTVLIGNNGAPSHREAIDALCTLRDAFTGSSRIRLLTDAADGTLTEVEDSAPDFSACASAVSWLPELTRLGEAPPPLIVDLISRVGHPSLRAYPDLIGWPQWSLRLEGLRVGSADAHGGWLDVGELGRFGDLSDHRLTWLTVTGALARIEFTADSLDTAAQVLARFATSWTGYGTTPPDADEHTLESRILRGAVPVVVADGATLQSVRPDAVVNWGAQFPTQWGESGGTSRRFLDAILRDGSTPWALELKVPAGGGVGRYYRHGIAQAVLYRHYIRSATPLHPLFASQQPPLDPTACRAALVVPRLQPGTGWRDRHRALASQFDVELVEVAP
ncbi:hypothetical protein [Salinibacterium sp. ZJ454]|uniref:hypothetical protein n=1 Tax=Salinibacterium sp. ZJ454 TaxID=2708339 RepID=UPI001423A558|nr:hypothetical protein [Salinibacterium sp. ZJ454]